MPEQERIKKQKVEQKETQTEEVEPQVPENAEDLKSEMDEILDEIDSVLEENAETFVKGFVQKGGQASITRGIYGIMKERTNRGVERIGTWVNTVNGKIMTWRYL